METTPQPETVTELFERLMAPQPTVIGIEGGPCSGKTTLVERLQATDSERPVIVLPEAATEHIIKLAERGLTVPELAANDREGFLAFEADVLQTIITNIEQAREQYAGTDAIIVADRCDIGAYLSDAEHQQLLHLLGRDMPPMLDLVDRLYYLPSVALEAPEKYDELKTNNDARYETLEQAQATCRANLAAVRRHPEIHVAWGGEFEAKLDHLVSSIMQPEVETELALEYFSATSITADIRAAKRFGRFLSYSRIVQSFHEKDGHEFRLRQVTTDRGETLHFFTVKTGEGLTRRELQRHLTTGEYATLQQLPQVGNTLEKARYEFLQPHMLSSRGVRKWTADHYDAPHLMRWQVEMDLYDDSQDEIFPWNIYNSGNAVARPTEVRARQLAEIALS